VPNGDKEMKVQQGWFYTGGGNHNGIDYVQGTIDKSSTWQNFPVVAAAAGKACADDERRMAKCLCLNVGSGCAMR